MQNVIITYNKKALKGKNELSTNEKAIMDVLEQDLRETAGKPYGRGWKSLGALDKSNLMHCHITYRKVVVWNIEEKHGEVMVTFCRFEYVGSREKAPY